MAQGFACPHCGQTIQVDAQHLGMALECPLCQGVFNAPAEGAAAGAPPAPEDEPVEPEPVGAEPPAEALLPEPIPLKPDRGVLILVLGILGIVSASLGVLCCAAVGAVSIALGIIAWVMGNRDLKEMRSGLMDPTNEGLTQAGRICGIVATILGGLGLLICVLWVAISLVMAFIPIATEISGSGF